MQSDVSTYGFTLPVAQAGQLYDIVDNQIESFAAEGAVPFGRACAKGTVADKQVLIPTTTGDVFRGVAVFTHTVEIDRDTGLAAHADGDAVSVLRKGKIWVEVTSDVAVDAVAYVDVAGTDLGKFTDVSSSNLATGGIFRTAASSGGLAVLEINLP